MMKLRANGRRAMYDYCPAVLDSMYDSAKDQYESLHGSIPDPSDVMYWLLVWKNDVESGHTLCACQDCGGGFRLHNLDGGRCISCWKLLAEKNDGNN